MYSVAETGLTIAGAGAASPSMSRTTAVSTRCPARPLVTRMAVGAAAYTGAWTAGASLPPEQAISLALEDTDIV